MSDSDMMPAPFGVCADTGLARDPLSTTDLIGINKSPTAAIERSEGNNVLGLMDGLDATDLTQTGWAVLFASDADPKIKEQLQPLLDWRQKQVQEPNLFQVFEGARGVKPGQSAASWAQSRGVPIAEVEPQRGVPYYLLIAGSLDRIPYEFQALLDIQWGVGRLYFDDIEDYGRYARKVVEYEAANFKPVQSRSVAAWVTRNPLDIATAMLYNAITANFQGTRKLGTQLGSLSPFAFDSFTADQASKDQLTRIMRGDTPSGPPALLFTGSHGAEYAMSDPDKQRRLQGALVTQAWSRGKLLDNSNQFSGDDVPSDDKLHGMIAFMFACYGGACPKVDNFYHKPDHSNIQVAPSALVSRLPQVMLSRGTLGIIAHVDRAFAYAFQNAEGTPQSQILRTPLDRIMKGQPIGLAADPINLQWGAYAAHLGLALGGNVPVPAGPQPPAITQLYVAREDARNYTVLGDPAVRLRTKDLA